MALTYEPISSVVTPGGSQVTFSSIPATYTDLRLVAWYPTGYNPNGDHYIFFNNDSNTSNYYSAYPYAIADPTSVVAQQGYANRWLYFSNAGGMYPFAAMMFVDIPSYTLSGKQKTAFYGSSQSRGDTTGGSIQWNYGLASNVTSAINRIDYYAAGGSLNSGMTLTLFGIKAA